MRKQSHDRTQTGPPVQQSASLLQSDQNQPGFPVQRPVGPPQLGQYQPGPPVQRPVDPPQLGQYPGRPVQRPVGPPQPGQSQPGPPLQRPVDSPQLGQYQLGRPAQHPVGPPQPGRYQPGLPVRHVVGPPQPGRYQPGLPVRHVVGPPQPGRYQPGRPAQFPVGPPQPGRYQPGLPARHVVGPPQPGRYQPGLPAQIPDRLTQPGQYQPGLPAQYPVGLPHPDLCQPASSASMSTSSTCSLSYQNQAAQSQAEHEQPPAPSEDPVQKAMDFWLKCLADWYPDRLKNTYFLPPLYFRRINYGVATVAGESVLVPKPTLPKKKLGPAPIYSSQSNQTKPALPVAGSVFTKPPASSSPCPLPRFTASHSVDDEATELVLSCLRALSEEQGEVMMVISQLEFRKYLDDKTDPINAAACALLPRSDPYQGDFDILIIHRRYGLIVGEVKGVGADMQNIHDLDSLVVIRVEKAVMQLNKAEAVLNQLVPTHVNVTKTVFLPNITSGQLTQAVNTNSRLNRDLCACLGSDSLPEAISRCLCSDQIPALADLQSSSDAPSAGTSQQSSSDAPSAGTSQQSSSDAPSAGTSQQSSSSTLLSKLSAWWRQITALNKGPDQRMSDSIYDELLARFCGPATSVEIPTVTVPRKAVPFSSKFTPARKVIKNLGQAVAEVGLILSTLALYPDQIGLLNDKRLQSVHIYGPPGTGKTVVLVLKGIQWLREGHDVHVLSTSERSRAVSMQIEQQLQYTRDQQLQQALDQQLQHALDPRPRSSVFRRVINVRNEKDVRELAGLACEGALHVIADEMPNYGLWNELKEKVPNLSLWCASVERLDNHPSWLAKKSLTTVLRSPPVVTAEVVKSQSFENSFIVPSYSTPSTKAASDGPPVRWLKHSKSLPGHTEGVPLECKECGENVVQLLKELGVGKSTGPGDLEYRDVVILCDTPQDEVLNLKRELVKDAPGMIQALRGKNVPVRVVTNRDSDTKIGVVALAQKNEVIVTDSQTMSGLERRVVIGMGVSNKSNASRSATKHRLMNMSRCTGQLVWIGNKPTF